MRTQSPDTHPDAERVLISLARQATPAEKFSQVETLSRIVIKLSRRAIARANPHFTEQEVNLRFVALHYGEALAERLQKRLQDGA